MKTPNKKMMAQALIDLHNCLPYSSEDAYNEMPEDGEPFEYVQELYENLLVDLWEIANRFPYNSLETIIDPLPFTDPPESEEP